MLYNSVLVSAVPRRDAVITLSTPLPLESLAPPSPHPPADWQEHQAGLLCTATTHFCLPMIVHIGQFYFLSSSLMSLSAVSMSPFFTSASVCPANRFMQYHFPRYHLYTLIYNICFSELFCSCICTF